MAHEDSIEQFLSLSAILTGYSRTDLLGTGLVHQYYDKLSSIVDEDICGVLWSKAREIPNSHGQNSRKAERKVRKDILGNPDLAPLATNIIQMWYLGSWSQLPQSWRNQNGAKADDVDHMISAEAYQAGLIWRAIGAHPSGALQPGFGSWALPPSPLQISSASKPSGRRKSAARGGKAGGPKKRK